MSIVQHTEQMDKGVFWLARLGNGDNDHTLVQQSMPAGMFIPLHRHNDIECIHVTSASMDVYAGHQGGWYTINGGESIVIQPDEPHAIRNVSGQVAESIGILTVRLTTFISQLGAIAADAERERPLAERRQSLRELADDYGYWLASEGESNVIRYLPSINA